MLLLEEEKKKLIKELQTKGIKDENILKAFYKVPREKFISEALRKFAYDDNALPIAGNQTISQPFTVAYMTSALQVEPGNKVLEIGTGSGYQSAILCELGADVYTIERVKDLSDTAKSLLTELGYNVHFKIGDGTLGWPTEAPFDRIIVTAGGPNIPDALLNQLNIHGRLVMPVGSMDRQKLHIIFKTEEGFDYKIKDNFKFVPLIGKEGWKAQE